MTTIFKHTDSDGDTVYVRRRASGNMSITCGETTCVILGEAEAAELRDALTSWLPVDLDIVVDPSEYMAKLEARVAELEMGDPNGTIAKLSVELADRDETIAERDLQLANRTDGRAHWERTDPR